MASYWAASGINWEKEIFNIILLDSGRQIMYMCLNRVDSQIFNICVDVHIGPSERHANVIETDANFAIFIGFLWLLAIPMAV